MSIALLSREQGTVGFEGGLVIVMGVEMAKTYDTFL